MALSEAYVAWETDLKAKSREEGEQRKASEIALNMLRGNISPEVVAKVTGLTIAQVLQLQPTEQ